MAPGLFNMDASEGREWDARVNLMKHGCSRSGYGENRRAEWFFGDRHGLLAEPGWREAVAAREFKQVSASKSI